MRKVAHGRAWFPDPALDRILTLMKIQASATRAAYQHTRRTGDFGNQVKKAIKGNYMAGLNQRYVGDACGLAAQKRNTPSVIFGGKPAWRDLQKGKISKGEWQQRRNSQLYSRGDKTKRGNPNIRIVGNRILVNDPSERGRWIEGKFWMPDKFEFNPDCYDVRLIYRKGQIEVKISSEFETPQIVTKPVSQGTIGIDCNPDGLAIVETNSQGQLVHHHYEKEQRIRFAKSEKQTYDIRQLAVRVVLFAFLTKKPLVLEELRFRAGKQKNKKFNRMRSNFLHRQMLEAIKSRAVKMGVEVVEVNPAFTSVLGKLKYQDMYSLNVHTAAALVIARRGMGYLESQRFTDKLTGRGGSRVNLEGRSRKHTLRPRAWSWLRDEFLRPKNSWARSPAIGSCNIAGMHGNPGEIPGGESYPITGRVRHSVSAER